MNERDILDIIEVMSRRWQVHPVLNTLVPILSEDIKMIVHYNMEQAGNYDDVRSNILRHVLKRIGGKTDLTEAHLAFFKRDIDTVQLIFEEVEKDDIEPENHNMPDTRVIFQYQEKVCSIIFQCLFNEKNPVIEDIECFAKFIFNVSKSEGCGDRFQRYRALFWYIYLVIEIVKTDEDACGKDSGYIKIRLKGLLEKVIKKQIDDCEDGKWKKTLFSYLQYAEIVTDKELKAVKEERELKFKAFIEKLIYHFNFDNTKEYASRRLLANHKRCVWQQIREIFCHGGILYQMKAKGLSMNDENLFEKFPNGFFNNVKQKMLIGLMPSEAVEAMLKPLLDNYAVIMPKLPLTVQDEIKDILKLYPEVKQAYFKQVSEEPFADLSGTITQIKQITRAAIKWVSPVWQLQWAGIPATGADIPGQEHIFRSDKGEIKITCKWKPGREKSPSYLEIEWNVNMVMDGILWCRFICTRTKEIFSEIRLGKDREGGKYLTTASLKFDPVKEPWELAVFIKEEES